MARQKDKSMSEPSRRYEVGDEVTLTVRVVAVDALGGAYVKVVGDEEEGPRHYFPPGRLDAGTLVPRAIQVGDREIGRASCRERV